MEKKICISKQTGLIGFTFVLGLVILIISFVVSNKPTTTQTRASTNCRSFECKVYGGSKYTGVAFYIKNGNKYKYYLSSDSSCSGKGYDSWKPACTLASEKSQPSPTITSLVPNCLTMPGDEFCTLQLMTGNYHNCMYPNGISNRCCKLNNVIANSDPKGPPGCK